MIRRIHIGDVIQVTGVLPQEVDPPEIGETGTVVDVFPDPEHRTKHILDIDWDNNRSLMLLSTDPFKVIKRAP